jgi:phosphoribosyl 1,2-cyclic phosphodiesterase
VKTDTKVLLFDAGISAKAIQERLNALQIPIEQLSAIFVSHEHHDHIAGIKSLCTRYQIPVIANYATAEAIVEAIDFCPTFKIFTTGEPFEFLDMSIMPFSVQHDGVDPVAFTIKIGDTKIGICTDLGFVTHGVRHELQDCSLLYIEANHQPEMVHASPRPDIYKRRVLGRTGHLSNEDAAKLLVDVVNPKLRKVYLAHLSSECNSPEVAKKIILNHLAKHQIDIDIAIAEQDLSTPTILKN